MKKKYLFISMFFLISSCANIETNIIKGDKQLSIFVASDSHLLSNKLVSNTNEIYIKKNLTSDGRIQEYDYELLNEFVRQVNILSPEYAILTGDLTFNGEKSSHEEIKEILNKIEDSKVLVIPGNHDINNVSPMSYVDDNAKYTMAVDEKIFKEIYDDFGYNDAISYDEESLSYFYLLDDFTYALMLDTTLSRFNHYYSMNVVGGGISDNTYSWIESNLIKAKNENRNVISFMHHNLLIHNELFTNYYTISDNQRIIDLYLKYNVKVNFSGHLHIQSIANQDNLLYDIATGGLLDYGNRYSRLDIYENAYEYKSIKLLPKGIKDFNKYSFDVFYQEYYDKSIKSNELYFKKDYKEITDFASKVNAYYFDGNYIAINELKKENRKYARKIKNSKKHAYIANMLRLKAINQDYFLEKK